MAIQPTTFTIVSTAVYSSTDGKKRIQWRAGDIIAYPIAVEFGLADPLPTLPSTTSELVEELQDGGGGGGVSPEAFAAKTRDTSYEVHVHFTPTPPEDGIDGDVYTPDGGTFFIRNDGEWEPIAVEDLSPYLDASSGLAIGDKAEAVRGSGAFGPVHVKTGSKFAVGYPVLYMEAGATTPNAIVMRGEDNILYQVTIDGGEFVIDEMQGQPEVIYADDDV